MAGTPLSLRDLTRSQIAIVLLAGILALAINGFFLLRSYEQEESHILLRQAVLLAQGIAATVDSFSMVSRALARDPEIQDLLLRKEEYRIRETLDTRRQHMPRTLSLALVDTGGRIYESRDFPLGPTCRQRLQHLIANINRAPDLPVNDPADPTRGQVGTLTPVRAPDGNQIIGYVFISFRFSSLREGFENFSSPDLRFRIRDRRGQIIYSSTPQPPEGAWLQSDWIQIPHTPWELQTDALGYEFGKIMLVLAAVNLAVAALVILAFALIQRRLQQVVQAELGQLHETLAAIHQGQTTLPDLQPGLADTANIWEDIGELAQDIHQQQKQLEQLSLSDALTGLANRRHFEMELERALSLAKRGIHVTLSLIDLDHFKAVNDNAGHLAGDAALRLFADTLRQHTRSSDFCARLGGDEFAVLCISLPETQQQEAFSRFATDFHARLQTHTALRGYGLSMSAGVISIDPMRDQIPTDCLRRADEALYAAKTQGRNRVVLGN